MELSYIRADSKRLREFGKDEKWLQDIIEEDPTILGLGDLGVIHRERRQPSGGRIDFLMYDRDQDDLRYVIEVMLGRLDESHIIRTIEYWDIERRRFHSHEHRAVIVAEEITNRFFNVISLFNQAIPIIALQLNAFQIENSIVLQFTKVLDITEVPVEIEPGVAEPVDRVFWEKGSNPNSLAVVDKIKSMVPDDHVQVLLTYNKGYIALSTTGRQFCWLRPTKTAPHCRITYSLDDEYERSEMIQKLEEAGLDAQPKGTRSIKLRLTEKSISGNEQLLTELIEKCEIKSRK